MKLSEIKPNPNNPRVIKDDKFDKLKKSIAEFPKMMALRPIVIDENSVIQGGNMRYRALIDLKFKEIPDDWVKKASDLTDEEKKRFIISDNVGFGEWDFEVLANEWDVDDLKEWGLDFPIFLDEPQYDELIGKEKNKLAALKLTFESVDVLQKAQIDIQELIDRKYKGTILSLSCGEL